MRAVIDTNVLISALMAPHGIPARIYNAWQEGHFTLLMCTEQA
jgi:predicted nucleic acid-binding protein